MNSYPFLDNKIQLLSDDELGDIVRPVRKSRVIDISESPFVPATELRSKLQHLLMAGELDSGLPILRNDILCGIMPAPDLEYALDTIEDEEHTMCLMSMDTASAVVDSEDSNGNSWVDFRRYIDPVWSLFSPAVILRLTGPCRLQSLSIYIRPSILSTNVLPSWDCAICAFSAMDSTQAWSTRRHSSNMSRRTNERDILYPHGWD